jgi:two-component sensor histidine kinase
MPPDLGGHLHAVCAPFRSGRPGQVVLVQDLAPGCDVREGQLLPISQVVSEVLTNAVKHAARAGAPFVVAIRCGHDDAGAVFVEVVDEGPGLPEGFDPPTDGGLGLRLVRLLAENLGARVAFDSSELGVRFRLTLPPA